MKLELKNIAPYLPYALEAINTKEGDIAVVITSAGFLTGLVNTSLDKYGVSIFPVDVLQPLLRPLSSMSVREAEEFGSVLLGEADMEDKKAGVGSIELFGDKYPAIMYQDKEDEEYSVMVTFGETGIGGVRDIPYAAYDWLFKNHFDIFGLIRKGLAVEK